jgi:hypothetical protein
VYLSLQYITAVTVAARYVQEWFKVGLDSAFTKQKARENSHTVTPRDIFPLYVHAFYCSGELLMPAA